MAVPRARMLQLSLNNPCFLIHKNRHNSSAYLTVVRIDIISNVGEALGARWCHVSEISCCCKLSLGQSVKGVM